MLFNKGDLVRVVLGTRVAKITGFEYDIYLKKEKVKLEYQDGSISWASENELLSYDHPDLDRIADVWKRLMKKGWKHIIVIQKSGDPKLYHKACKDVNEQDFNYPLFPLNFKFTNSA
ncbi:MAG: hypothetical protein MI975_24705 [Cytophagales bacterium]|nr:hypothetical protein [Cytophagales bacterium]